MDDTSHRARLAAAQTVFRVEPHTPPPSESFRTGLTVPDTEPTEEILDQFWRRVAELTTRYHDSQRKWICGDEIRMWNSENRKACENCVRSKNKKTCIVDEDQPSCRTCRDYKIGCDRKPLFVFEMTKSSFFASYEQFLKIYRAKEPGRLRRYKKAPMRLPGPSSSNPDPTGSSVSKVQAVACHPTKHPLDVYDVEHAIDICDQLERLNNLLANEIRPLIARITHSNRSSSAAVRDAQIMARARLVDCLNQIRAFE
ncbi:hypothetical protein DFH06DRAFT_1485049 [Mycena polygramma]|nr:hypothetical protein DFH06DRAFT_1485049 [Mycena polygramma]